MPMHLDPLQHTWHGRKDSGLQSSYVVCQLPHIALQPDTPTRACTRMLLHAYAAAGNVTQSSEPVGALDACDY